MNNFFKICFCLFAVVFGAMYGLQENENTCYKRLIRNQPFRMLTSAVIGGLSAMGLKYSINNNKFLSSLRLPEKIKNATDTKYFLVGSIAGIGLYEWVNRFMKRQKKTNNDTNNPPKGNKETIHQVDSGARAPLTNPSVSDQPVSPRGPKAINVKTENDYKKRIEVSYCCPGSLYSLFKSLDGLKTETVESIEYRISRSEIKKYSKNKFWYLSSNKKSSTRLQAYLKKASYAAAIYLIEEEQKEEFEKRLTIPLIKGELLLYKLYEIKPNSTENLWCYALPLQYVVDEQGQKSYSLEISSEITPENMQEYAFQLPKEDAKKINLNAPEIVGAEAKTRTAEAKTRTNEEIFY